MSSRRSNGRSLENTPDLFQGAAELPTGNRCRQRVRGDGNLFFGIRVREIILAVRQGTNGDNDILIAGDLTEILSHVNNRRIPGEALKPWFELNCVGQRMA